MEHVKRLIFVCVENSNRSQMARRSALHGGARSRRCAGSRPSGALTRGRRAMGELG
jgi:hypothetical protein